jgi:hypothetical protein
VEANGQLYTPDALTPGKNPYTQFIGDWCGLQDISGILALAWIRTLEDQPIA